MSKGANLSWAVRHLSNCQVPIFIEVSAEDWHTRRDWCILRIQSAFLQETNLVAVRSNARDEDTALSTNAGRYRSMLNVNLQDDAELQRAVDEVVASMLADGVNTSGHSVIVQAMVTNVVASGAATTRDPNTGAPYMVITYDTGGDTSAVTSGRTAPLFVAIRHGASIDLLPPMLRWLSPLLNDVMTFRRPITAEVEFAIQNDLTVVLLQIRDLPFAAAAWEQSSSDTFRRARTAIRRRMRSKVSCLSDMADWNPAEMIGRSPRQLAYSLYRGLITRKTWRRSRAMFGYHNPLRQELMYRIGSRPYVDIRASLSSLTPAVISDDTRNAMLDADVERILENQTIHSRIEFEASVSCVTAGTSGVLRERYQNVLPSSQIVELRQHLVTITTRSVRGDGLAGLRTIRAKLETLSKEIDLRVEHGDKGQWLEGRAWAYIGEPLAVAFASAARHAFIGESMLRSLIVGGILDGSEAGQFRRSVHTVTYSFIEDVRRLHTGDLSESAFRTKYGHLRPGTYDIRSLPYSHYSFGDIDFEGLVESGDAYQIDNRALHENVLGALRAVDLDVAPDILHRYIASSIRLRELGKFVYSRFVSLLLEDAAAWGLERGLVRDDMSYLSIEELRRLQATGVDGGELRRIVRRSLVEHESRVHVLTPSILWKEDQLWVVTADVGYVTFIGRSLVRGKVVIVGDLTTPSQAVKGRIACVERADPGYDWLLAAGVVGIVTRYGGPNAHLAVRCAELSIPAAIGCGEALFRQLLTGEWLEIDCASEIVRTVDGR